MAFSSASLVRAFSTSGLKRAVVKTPIPVFGIEGRCEIVPMGPTCNCILQVRCCPLLCRQQEWRSRGCGEGERDALLYLNFVHLQSFSNPGSKLHDGLSGPVCDRGPHEVGPPAGHLPHGPLHQEVGLPFHHLILVMTEKLSLSHQTVGKMAMVTTELDIK